MSDALGFDLAEMGHTEEEILRIINEFSDAVVNLNSAIINMGDAWISRETGTYEKLVELFNEKKKSLEEAEAWMQDFYTTFVNKEAEFSDMSDRLRNSLQ